jgi:hypothetical protein
MRCLEVPLPREVVFPHHAMVSVMAQGLDERPDVRGAPECLVLMPMLAGYEGVRAVVARAVAAAGASMSRLEEILPDPDWQYWLVEAVSRADLVLADVTDHNAFVMYELGLAHQRGLPAVLIVSERNERVPATVLGSPFLPYDGEHLDRFEDELAAAIEAVAGQLPASGAEALGTPSAGAIARWYEEALGLLALFNAETSVPAEAVAPEEFAVRLRVASRRGAHPPSRGGDASLPWYLLPRVIRDADRVETMRRLVEWVGAPRAR